MRDSTICQKCTSECTVQSQDVFSIKKLFLCRHVHSSKLAKPVPPASDHLGNGLERVVGGEGKSPKKLNSPGDLSFSLSPMMYISPEGASSSTSEEAEEDAHQHTETGREEKGRRGNICFIQDDRMRRRRQCPDKREELDGRLSLLPSSPSSPARILASCPILRFPQPKKNRLSLLRPHVG